MTQPNLIVPASLWRRLAASVYDGLLLIALWMVGTLLDVIVRQALGLQPAAHAFQLFLFLIGLGFFGWFWTHGGQTLGMRAWRLQLRRSSGEPVRWPVAAIRYAAMLASWGIVLAPAILRLPHLRDLSQASAATAASVALTAAGLLVLFIDPKKRVPCDFIASTEVVCLPKAG